MKHCIDRSIHISCCETPYRQDRLHQTTSHRPLTT